MFWKQKIINGLQKQIDDNTKHISALENIIIKQFEKERGAYLYTQKNGYSQIIDVPQSIRCYGDSLNHYIWDTSNIETIKGVQEMFKYVVFGLDKDDALKLYQDEATMFFHTLEEAQEYQNALTKVKEDFQKAGKINKGLKQKGKKQ